MVNLRVNIWIALVVAAAAILYPLQRMMINKHSLKREHLQEEVLKVSSLYQVNSPDQSFLLSPRLAEISGLSLGFRDSTLVAVQDEEGIIYELTRAEGKILDQQKFGEDEDYEGVEVVGNRAYIINSKGNIHLFDNSGSMESRKIKTELKRDDDVEGLTYLEKSNSLLLACKSNRTGKKKGRNIYRFDLEKMLLDTAVYLVLNPEIIARKLKREKKTPYFSPSAISQHPLSGEIFILSSVARAIVVFDHLGELVGAANLDRSVHLQPEGMAIDSSGRLYIANEARGGVAKLHVFDPNVNKKAK